MNKVQRSLEWARYGVLFWTHVCLGEVTSYGRHLNVPLWRSCPKLCERPVEHAYCLTLGCSQEGFFSVALRPNAGRGLLILEVSRSHTMTPVGRTPLDEWSARRRDLYLTTHNTHNRQTSMPPVGFESTISAGEWPQTYPLDRAATGTGARR